MIVVIWGKTDTGTRLYKIQPSLKAVEADILYDVMIHLYINFLYKKLLHSVRFVQNENVI